MNAQQMLAMGGFPDTAEGRQAFYNQYPDEASFHKKMKTGGSSGLAFPQQPTAGEFYAPQYTPNSPVGFYKHGGLAYPQQPPADMFFSGHPFTPEYARGGMPCMDCGGYMDDGGQASPFGYGQMPPTIGMAYGGSAKSFSKAMKKHFADGGTAPQGSTMEQNYDADKIKLQAFIGGNVTNVLSTEEYNKPVHDMGGENTFNYGQADQLEAMQTGLDMSEQQRQYQKQQSLSNLINSYALGGLPKHQTNGQVSSLYQHPNVLSNKGKKQAFEDYKNTFDWRDYDYANYNLRYAQPDLSDRLMNEEYEHNLNAMYRGNKEITLDFLKEYEDRSAMRAKEFEDAKIRQSEAKKKIPNWIPEYQQENEYTWPQKQMGGLPQAQMGIASDAERMFGQAPSFGKKTSPLYFGHTQGSTAANATSGSLNPELIAQGNQLAQDIHNFNPSGAGVQFTPEQLRYLQQMSYGRQQQQGYGYNPGYRIKTKGFSNSADGTQGTSYKTRGTSDSPFPMFGSQGPGSFDMSRGLNAQQIADMNKYYNAHGMNMDYKEKNGFLGKLFGMGPRSIEMHLGSLNNPNQKNPAQSAQSATAASSSNPSGGGFHPFDGMKKRMAERKYNRSADAMSDADAAQWDAENVTAADRQRLNPAMNRSQMNELSDLPVTNFNAYQQPGPTVRAYGGTPSVYLPHGYQEGGANEVENDNDADDAEYEYMTPEEIAEYISAGGQIKYV
jgi:hypothetical protein